MRILQINQADIGGGAENISRGLHEQYRARGWEAWLAVGRKLGDDPYTLRIPNEQYAEPILKLARRLQQWIAERQPHTRGLWRLRQFIDAQVHSYQFRDHRRGIENMRYPGSWHVLDLLPGRPDIIHCQDLVGHCFDLRALPWLSRQAPLVMTMHDAWLLAGHCIHSLDCERWRTGCGACPYLDIDMPMPLDNTAYNWRRKRDVFARSRVYVASPSRWLAERVQASLVAPALIENRVIPNGIDLSVFNPGDRREARAALDIPQDAHVLLFIATAVRKNIWKDFAMLQHAAARAAERMKAPILLIAIGEGAPMERLGHAEIRFIPVFQDARALAGYYRAADIYTHAVRADTFPTVILEALACGTPVVATAVCGIPEQIVDGETGYLVPAGDVEAMAANIAALLGDEGLRRRMGEHAAADAKARFNLCRMVDDYQQWYQTIIGHTRHG